ncbi:MAG: hypothetical protein IT562_12405 [Alphaproteobacteria bacterium]|nr:hypothetical protein [Alphaproteobacteria bacterium]
MIPRILHYVWVGGRPLPEKTRINIETWRRFCPDFEIRGWTDDTVSFEHPYLARCRALGNWANASNYLRLVKLLAHGGVYLDTDIMLRRPLAPMLRNGCFLGFQVEAQENDWINNAVFGAEPGHWFVELCRQRLLEAFDGSEPANFSSPRLVTRLLIEKGLARYDDRGVSVGDVRIYPRPVFYPYSWREEFTLAAIKPETTAVHFWEKSWHADPAATPAESASRTALERLELKHHRLIRDAVLAVKPRRARGRRWRGLVDWLHRLVTPSARTAGRLGLVLAAIFAAQAASAANSRDRLAPGPPPPVPTVLERR